MEQINLLDERWYEQDGKYYPSVTWILDSYPKDKYFFSWLRENGEEAEKIKESAGVRGSKVHNAIEDLLSGKKLKIKDPYFDKGVGMNLPLTDVEWAHLAAFQAFWEDYTPKVVATERAVFYAGKTPFAGTMDALLTVDGVLTVFDWKTSSAMYPTYRMQVAAYAKALQEMKIPVTAAMVIRTNTKHKKRYEVLELDKDEMKTAWEDFQAIYKVWQIQHGKTKPAIKEFPAEIELTIEYDNELINKLSA